MSPIDIRPAVRKDVPILVLLAGGTGAGKTESALRLATGMAGGKRFAVIDTERGRALHKADDYAFDHAPLEAPFTPEAYAAALEQVDALGYPVIVIDSGSHEYEGEGGVLDIQEAEFQRLGGRESTKMVSWAVAKQRHKVWRNALLRARAHVIVCHRAEDKIEVGKDAQGKTVIRPKQSLTGADGWVPICERRLPFEATISLLFTADAPGVPKPIKLETRHAGFVPLDRKLDERVGEALAAWAAGSKGSAEEPSDDNILKPGAPAVVADSMPAHTLESSSADTHLVTEAQRKRMFAIAKAQGVPTTRLREILEQVTGQGSTAQIPSSLYEAVCDAVLAEAEQAIA